MCLCVCVCGLHGSLRKPLLPVRGSPSLLPVLVVRASHGPTASKESKFITPYTTSTAGVTATERQQPSGTTGSIISSKLQIAAAVVAAYIAWWHRWLSERFSVWDKHDMRLETSPQASHSLRRTPKSTGARQPMVGVRSTA